MKFRFDTIISNAFLEPEKTELVAVIGNLDVKVTRELEDSIKTAFESRRKEKTYLLHLLGHHGDERSEVDGSSTSQITLRHHLGEDIVVNGEVCKRRKPKVAKVRNGRPVN